MVETVVLEHSGKPAGSLAPRRDRAGMIFLGLLTAIFIGFFAQVFRRTTQQHFGDFRHFYYAARAFYQHTNLYTSGDGGYLYPPLVAMLYAPIAHLGFAAAARVMLLFNVAFGLGGILLISREYTQRLDAPWTPRFVYGAALLGALMNFDKIHMDLQMFQTNALMFFMFALSVRWLDRHPLLAGLPLGFIFNIKYLSLALLPWLIVRRRWGTAFAFIASAVGFALLPAVFSGWKQNLDNLQVAYGGLLHMVGIGHGGVQQANVEDITAWFSCSITSAMARATLIGVPMTLALICAAIAALCSLAVVTFIYRRENLPMLAFPNRRRQVDQPWRAMIGLEFSALVIATMCFSPQTNTKHLMLALLLTVPTAVLILSARRPVPRYVLVIGAIILMAGFSFPRNSQRGTQLMWIGAGGLCWCLLIALLTMLSTGLMHAGVLRGPLSVVREDA